MVDRRLRWGLLSTARINVRIMDAVAKSNRSEIVAAASRDADRAVRYAAEHSIPASYGSYEGLVTSPDVDVIYVSLPNPQHAHWGIRAAANGKHVLIEKPIALEPADVAQLEKAAEENGVVIQEASMMRFHPQTALLRDLVGNGAIGTPRWARGSHSFTLRRQGDIRLQHLGGGSIWDLGCYPVTLFQAVLQLAPREASGFKHTGSEDVDMTFSAQIRYEGDVFGQFISSMEAIPSSSAEFVGSTGYIRVTYPWLSHIGVDSTVELVRKTDAGSAATFDNEIGDQSTQYSFNGVNAYVDEVRAMESMILDGTEHVFPLSESAVNVATIQALLDSTSSGKPVMVDT